jgi:hypothetical protein
VVQLNEDLQTPGFVGSRCLHAGAWLATGPHDHAPEHMLNQWAAWAPHKAVQGRQSLLKAPGCLQPILRTCSCVPHTHIMFVRRR